MLKEQERRRKRYEMGDDISRDKLRTILEKNKTRLSISRVPEETKKEFTDFAKEEYNDDWGFALKGLWDAYREYIKIKDSWLDLGELNKRMVTIEANMEVIMSQIMEEKDDDDDNTPIKTIGGRVIKTKK